MFDIKRAIRKSHILRVHISLGGGFDINVLLRISYIFLSYIMYNIADYRFLS